MAIDYMAEIKKLEEDGVTEDEKSTLAYLTKLRGQKITSDPTLSQYAQSQADLEARYSLPTETTTQADPNEALYQRQQELLKSQLESQRQSTLQGIESERATELPKYQQTRNAISGTAAQQAKALDEYLARSGVTGSTAQANLAQQQRGQEQANLAASYTAQNQYESDLARRAAQADTTYQQALQQGNLQLGIQQLQNQQAQQEAAQQLALQEAQLTGVYGGQQTLAGQQQAFNQAATQAQLAENQRQFDLNYGQSVREFEANYGLNLRQQTFNEAQAAIQNAISQGQLSVSQGNLALQQAKFYADNDPNSIDNQLKQQQLTAAQLANRATEQSLQGGGRTDTTDFENYIKQMYVLSPPTYNAETGTYGQARINTTGISNYLLSLLQNGQITETDADYIASLYGL